ncbi:MAG: hypothetical protein N2Z82_10975, partial [Thermomicrobium sp.]|nr:hypothetical protein [Thermomicrobium sp.]
TLLLVTAEDASGRASRLTTFASGFVAPRGVTTAGTWVYVVEERGLVRLRDDDGDGIADRTEAIPLTFQPLPAPAGAPVADQRGRVFLAGTSADGAGTATIYVVNENRVVPLGPAPPGLVRLLAWGELLFAIVQEPGEPAQVLRLAPRGQTLLAEPFLELPLGFTPAGGLAYTTPLWADLVPGTLFFWGTRETGGALLRALPNPDGQSASVSLFATALHRPVAMVVGLDGILYVADADTGQLVKIVPGRRSLG